jgi:hypothetical protein
VDAKLKHLEFIQAAIARMAMNSFLFKGWAITVATGLSAFAAVETRAAVFVIALLATTVFWLLDGYYLWLERGFAQLHVIVAAKSESEIDFSMAIDRSNAAKRWLLTCVSRPHLPAFYCTLIVLDLIGVFLINGSS